MPTVNSSAFGPKPQWVDLAGAPMSGYQLFTYVGGSVDTKQNSYTDSTGNTANPNPIVLDSLGMTPDGYFWEAGLTFKAVLASPTDTDPPTSPIWTEDGLKGQNDTTVTQSQWVAGPAPTFISATSFSLAGDQTSEFQVGRRLLIIDGVGTKYATIDTSSYNGSTLTTVTTINDDGLSLSSPLSAVSYGLLSSTNISIPRFVQAGTSITISYDSSGRPVINAVLQSQMQTVTGTVGSSALTAGYSGGILDFRSATLSSGAPTQLTVGALSLVVSAGSTLGTTSALPARLWLAVINNAGTGELAIINTQLANGGVAPVNESSLISTTAEGGAGAADSAGVWYSTTARSNVPFRLVGYLECTEATAGTWATAPAVIQGMNDGVRKPGDEIQDLFNPVSAEAHNATTFTNNNSVRTTADGSEYMSQAVVPTSAINTLRIDAKGNWACSSSTSPFFVGVFQDATVNALRTSLDTSAPGGANQSHTQGVTHQMRAGTVVSTTIKVRAAANTGTTTFNGSASAALGGGILDSYISIKEIMA